MSAAKVEQELDRLAALARACKVLAPQLDRLGTRYADTLRAGGTLYFCGNGGSAADAQHLATEYVVRYAVSRRALAAVALTTDTSILTAAGNDLGFEQIFSRQVEALCRSGDLLVLHSTSGRSPNLLEAARAARRLKVPTVAFLGRGGGPLADEVDESVVVPSDDTSQIQVLHLALEHLVVELVESALVGVG
ncbi:MAG TPA: SIS domain-containing protein [Gemmatimonadales bacterium]|nr:SIS domain-containing protein [Gemmatimonadales bacterium]